MFQIIRVFGPYTYQGRIQDLGLGGGVSRRGVWGPLKVPQLFQNRALVGGPGEYPPPPRSGGLRKYIHIFERQF